MKGKRFSVLNVSLISKHKNSFLDPLRGYIIPSQIKKMCNSISSHVQNISKNNVSVRKMILYFKID